MASENPDQHTKDGADPDESEKVFADRSGLVVY